MRPRLVVVGDVILDEDIHAGADRLVPDAPVPVLTQTACARRPGGAALTALLAARLGTVDVTLVAPAPDDDDGRRLHDLLPADVQLVALPCAGQTIVKTRLMARGQTVARLDRGSQWLSLSCLTEEARAALREASVVLVSDYGGGATSYLPLRELLAECAAAVPTVWDPHPRGEAPVAGVLMVTPNTREATALSGVEPAGGHLGVRRQAARLLAAWEATCVVVTMGAEGALMCVRDGSASVFPAAVTAGGDTCGAGDCFAAAAAAAVATGDLPSEAVARAVELASRFVSAGGVATLDGCGRDWPGRSATAQTAVELAASVRARGGTVVATGGCFDLLHAGHIQTLEAARRLGDCLVVCLNSDASVRRLKGPGRPIQPVSDRMRVLAALRHVDAVHVFDEDTPENAIRLTRPQVWVKGGDYTAADLPEARVLEEWGGAVLTVPYLAGRSTTALAESFRR